MKIRQVIHYFFRLLFCVSLMLLSYKSLISTNTEKSLIINNVTKLENILRNHQLSPKVLAFTKYFKDYASEIIIAQSYVMIVTSFLSLVNFSFGKDFGFIAILVNLLFINNPIIDTQRKVVFKASVYLGLYGGLIAY